MNDPRVADALALWGLEGCLVTLVAARENQVFRVEALSGPLALRLHRPGYRSRAELASELAWMAALEGRGVKVPRPVPANDGSLCVAVAGTFVDVLTYLEGTPLIKDGQVAQDADSSETAFRLGGTLARLHDISDEWNAPAGFVRPAWDVEGLLGDNPLWGRFWENPALTRHQAELLTGARRAAQRALSRLGPDLDYGLIHADAVPENVLVGDGAVYLVDFDDGGFGFRLFDLATTVNRLQRHAPDGAASRRFLDGYLKARPIDLRPLPLFRLLRSLTYVGWVIARIDEPGAAARCTRFIDEAISQAKTYLEYAKD
ncbi:phosphotransferase [Mesorhizobium sp. WSM4976]|uniref:phosphotransferase enzyme family protein n=1 Tax=Mesorhizobium sp. WSM4976 TaxID=3038549 RepID=UPI002415D80E|nr:phosphotransferase [Mesorhizobium sp. WSM4976]MDG4897635.1 phosphotransferase [Mesorhizobium sp. WSM4976]